MAKFIKFVLLTHYEGPVVVTRGKRKDYRKRNYEGKGCGDARARKGRKIREG